MTTFKYPSWHKIWKAEDTNEYPKITDWYMNLPKATTYTEEMKYTKISEVYYRNKFNNNK